MRGEVRVTAAQGYKFHQITAPSGAVVREYVSPEGKVFGVCMAGAVHTELAAIAGILLYAGPAGRAVSDAAARRPLHRAGERFRLCERRPHAVFPWERLRSQSSAQERFRGGGAMTLKDNLGFTGPSSWLLWRA